MPQLGALDPDDPAGGQHHVGHCVVDDELRSGRIAATDGRLPGAAFIVRQSKDGTAYQQRADGHTGDRPAPDCAPHPRPPCSVVLAGRPYIWPSALSVGYPTQPSGAGRVSVAGDKPRPSSAVQRSSGTGQSARASVSRSVPPLGNVEVTLRLRTRRSRLIRTRPSTRSLSGRFRSSHCRTLSAGGWSGPECRSAGLGHVVARAGLRVQPDAHQPVGRGVQEALGRG